MSTLVQGEGLSWISFNGVSLWAQYAEGNYAINEWEIRSGDYRVERASDGSEIKIYFIEPSTTRALPNRCENCIETAGISISIRDVLDSKRIAFKLNDPDNSLPSPFPRISVVDKIQGRRIFRLMYADWVPDWRERSLYNR